MKPMKSNILILTEKAAKGIWYGRYMENRKVQKKSIMDTASADGSSIFFSQIPYTFNCTNINGVIVCDNFRTVI